MRVPSHMECERVLARLWEYIDGELPPDTTAAMRTHIDGCQSCSQQHDFQRAFVSFLGEMGRAGGGTPTPIRRRVFDSLLREETPDSSN